MNRFLLIVSGILLVLFVVVALNKSDAPLDAVSDPGREATAEKETVRRFWIHYRQATDDRMAGRYEKAEEEYLEALALNDRHEDGLYYLGNVYHEQGKFQEAEATWKRLIQINPNSARTHSRLGTLYLCREDPSRFAPEAARESFARAHEINREETGPLLRLGEAALLIGDWTAAAAYFDAVTGSNFSSVEGHFYRGFVAWKAGDLPKAQEWFRQAVSYSRRSLTQDGIVGEGETRQREHRTGEDEQHCPLFEASLGDITAYSEDAEPDRVSRRYREVEAYLNREAKNAGIDESAVP